MALAASALGVVWYVVCTRLVIPAFNQGQQPFYIGYFYGSYGSDTVEIAETIITRPDRVVSDATQPDRLRFYRDLLLPWGGLPLGRAAPARDGRPAVARQRDRKQPVRAIDPVPVHGGDDRADRDRVDRGGRVDVEVPVRPDASWCRGCWCAPT